MVGAQPGEPAPDHYQLPGIRREASRADIAHAYRQPAPSAGLLGRYLDDHWYQPW